jgi:hypothetical protein
MQFKEVITVYNEKHEKTINKNAELLTIKQVGHIGIHH